MIENSEQKTMSKSYGPYRAPSTLDFNVGCYESSENAISDLKMSRCNRGRGCSTFPVGE